MQAQNGSLFPSAVVTLYCSYLCYSALQSEPHDYQCNGLGKHFTAASGSTLAIGMVIAIVSVVYSALRAGSNNRTFMAVRDEAVEEGLLESSAEGTSAGLDGEPQGQTMGKLLCDSVFCFIENVLLRTLHHLLMCLCWLHKAVCARQKCTNICCPVMFAKAWRKMS